MRKSHLPNEIPPPPAKDPAFMRSRGRLREVATIFAAGYLRLSGNSRKGLDASAPAEAPCDLVNGREKECETEVA